MRIKEGDRVMVKKTDLYDPKLKELKGTVEAIHNSLCGDIAIVNYNRYGKVKIFVDDLEIYEESVVLNRAKFNELRAQVLDRDSFDISEDKLEVIQIVGKMVLDRLAILLFEEGANG